MYCNVPSSNDQDMFNSFYLTYIHYGLKCLKTCNAQTHNIKASVPGHFLGAVAVVHTSPPSIPPFSLPPSSLPGCSPAGGPVIPAAPLCGPAGISPCRRWAADSADWQPCGSRRSSSQRLTSLLPVYQPQIFLKHRRIKSDYLSLWSSATPFYMKLRYLKVRSVCLGVWLLYS